MGFIGRGINTIRTVGNQTADGIKTFLKNIIQEYNNIKKGTAPSGTVYKAVEFTDKNGAGNENRIGTIETQITSSGQTGTYLAAYKFVNGSTDSARLGVYYPTSGSAYTSAPTPTDTTTTSGSQIATTGWVNSIGNNVIHLSGDETITGRKVVEDNYFNFKMSDIAYSETPTTNHYAGIDILDKNNTQIGTFYLAKYSDGSGFIGMGLKNKAGDSSGLNIRYNSNNVFYTTAPASDATNSIVTTVNKSKAANGYFKLGNGLIIQWGSKTLAAATAVSVTLPTPFTTTNYMVAVSRNTAANATGNLVSSYVRGSKTTTGFELYSGNGDQGTMWIAVGY